MTKTAVDTFEPSTLDHSKEWLEFLLELGVLSRGLMEMGQRRGQAIMNALLTIRLDLYQHATGQLWDPFFRDEKLFEFWHQIYDQFILTMDD